MTEKRTLAVFGAGNLGGAIVRGLCEAHVMQPSEIAVCDLEQDKLDELKPLGVHLSRDAHQTADRAEAILIAVKPYHVVALLESLRDVWKRSGCAVIISVAAGVGAERIRAAVGDVAPVVRVMPNLPSLIRRGVAGIWSADKVAAEVAARIFRSVGETVFVEREELLDTVTALSAGGPAFVSRLIEGFIEGGVKMGLSQMQARTLTLEMVRGTAELLLARGIEPAELVSMVATPGGTTIHGLHELERGAVRSHLISAIEASTRRARDFR